MPGCNRLLLPLRAARRLSCRGGLSPSRHARPTSAGKRVVILAALAAVSISGSPAPLLAAGPTLRGTSSRAARDEALSSLPLDKLDPAGRRKVDEVLSHVSLFRRMPVQSVPCDPDLYLYVVNHPEIIADIWQLLGVEDVVLKPTGPETYVASDGAGTQGNVEFLYRGHDTHVFFAEGSYDGPLFAQPVKGKCILVLKSGYVREPDGLYYVTGRLDVFVSLQHVGADFLARTFHPLVGKVADHNFVATGQFLSNLSLTAERNPQGIRRVAARLTNISPETRDKFVALTDQVAERAASRGVRYAEADNRDTANSPVMRAQGPLPTKRR